MRRRTILGVLGFVAAVALVFVAPDAVRAQPPGGGGGPGRGGPGGGGGRGRGMMGTMLYLERSWTAVSFQLGCTAQQQAALRPTYLAALQARDAAIKKARDANDMQAIGTAFEKCKTTLDAKLKKTLSAAQWKKLETMMQPRTGQGGGRPGGAPGGPPRTGGAR
jgi:Spy/CpxP family protein refolding chaperone